MPRGPCARCGDWPDDDERYGSYCRPCQAERVRLYNRRRRLASLGKWTRQAKFAAPDRLGMLAYEIVDRLGGYERAAKEIIDYARANRDKAPRRSMDAYLAILKLITTAIRD